MKDRMCSRVCPTCLEAAFTTRRQDRCHHLTRKATIVAIMAEGEAT
jgi:hypothetical protein